MTSKQNKTTDQMPSTLYLSAFRIDYKTVDTEKFQFLTGFEMAIGGLGTFMRRMSSVKTEHGYSHPLVQTKFTG